MHVHRYSIERRICSNRYEPRWDSDSCIICCVSVQFFISLFTNLGSSIHLYGGDIVLTPEQQATLEATSNPNDPFAPQNAVVRNSRSLWTGGIMPYVLDSSLSKWQRNVQSSYKSRVLKTPLKQGLWNVSFRHACCNMDNIISISK